MTCLIELLEIDLVNYLTVCKQMSLIVGVHPIISGLSATTPQIWCVSLIAKPRGRYQLFGANSRISYKVGNWKPVLRRETAVAGPSFLAEATTSG